MIEAFAGPHADVLLTWCTASAGRRDAELAKLLAAATKDDAIRERAQQAVRDRVIEGPLLDALACAPLLGDGKALRAAENAEARARLVASGLL